MGLDISLHTSNEENLADDTEDYFYRHSLSRTFCNLMCRAGVVNEEPELDQIARLIGVDISPIYEMENYMVKEDLEDRLEFADSEEERQQIRKRAAITNAELDGNLDKVLTTITELLERLILVTDLPDLLLPTAYDTLNRKMYFANFTRDIGDGYIGNNFGQDLRNFKSFLEYAKSRDSRTVFFRYGWYVNVAK